MSTYFVILALTYYRESFNSVCKKKLMNRIFKYLSSLSTKELIDLIKFKEADVLKLVLVFVFRTESY